MSYYETIEKDLTRARAMVAARAPEISQGVVGGEVFVAYKLLESFIAEIEQLRAKPCGDEMITATATDADGMKVIVLGITRKNVERLVAGDPIRVSAKTHPGFPEHLSILILFGETERAMTEQLTPVIGDDTKMITVPRTDPQPQ